MISKRVMEYQSDLIVAMVFSTGFVIVGLVTLFITVGQIDWDKWLNVHKCVEDIFKWPTGYNKLYMELLITILAILLCTGVLLAIILRIKDKMLAIMLAYLWGVIYAVGMVIYILIDTSWCVNIYHATLQKSLP